MKRNIWLGIAIILFFLNAGAVIVLLMKSGRPQHPPAPATAPATQPVPITRP